MSVNITSAEMESFSDYVRAGVPPEAARRFAREEALSTAEFRTNEGEKTNG